MVELLVVAPPYPGIEQCYGLEELTTRDDGLVEARLHLRVNDQVDLAERIRMTVVAVRGESVRIGVDAPRTVQIFREEVYEAILRENLAAAKPSQVGESPELSTLRRLGERLLSGPTPEREVDDEDKPSPGKEPSEED